MRAGFSERQQIRHAMRHEAVQSILKRSGVQSVLDLGCGDGQLFERLVPDTQFKRLTGVDAEASSLMIAEHHIRPLANQRNDLNLSFCLNSLLCLPEDISSHQAVTMVEVIEHFKPEEVRAVEQLIFGHLQPEQAIFTTPAAPLRGAPPSREDHQFEWAPSEANQWADRVAQEFGYQTSYQLLSSAPLPGLDMQVIVFDK